jgi:predicted adenylyl cyclase CyaB
MKNNVEIEVKVLEINTKELEKKLVAVGAKKIFSNNKIVQESYKNKELQKKRASIRVRQIGKELYITFKEFKEIKQNVKNCKEIEFQVSSDFKTIQEVFLALGLKKHRRIEKIRTSYKLKDITFDIDEVIKPFKIPCYFEIEAKSYKEIEKTLQLLDIPKSKAKPWGTKQLLKHYEKMKK